MANKFGVKDSDPLEDKIPGAIASWLNQEADYENFMSLATNVNYPVADIAAVLEAVKLTSQRQWTPAREKFRRYLDRAPRQPDWAYGYDTLVRELDAAIGRHLDAIGAIDKAISEGKLDEARRLFENYEGALTVFSADWAAYEEKVKALASQQQAEQQRIESAERQQRALEEVQKLDTILAEIIPGMLRSNNFGMASISIAQRTSSFSTDEARAAAAVERERVDALEGLKKFLIAATDLAPFTRRDGFRLGGDMTKASLQGIRTAVAGRTQMIYNWDEVPPDVIAKAVDFYSRHEAISSGERAEALVGLAVFSVMHQQPGAASGFATRALEMNPQLAEKISRLTPGLETP